MKYILKNFTRALRLPFLSVSILPFVFGSLIERRLFNLSGFVLGFITVAAVHLSANLINDYADSKSGADWQDRNFYGFFGGSKLIQENVFSEKSYLYMALFFLSLSFLCAILLAAVLEAPAVIGLYLAIAILSWAYSQLPLRFSYRRLGEIIIFILFGPALVMGGYFIQTRIFPDLKSFILSLPFGFLTTAILFANEVPDLLDDSKVRKFNWVSITGKGRAFLLFGLLVFLAFSSILFGIICSYISFFAACSFIFIPLAFKAAGILRKHYDDKARLVESSRLSIILQTSVSIILIFAIII